MNFTKRTEYALRALIEIGSADKEVPVKRDIIAKNQNLSKQYLEQILIPLSKSKIIKSVRGPGGGFVLNKTPKDINAWDVFSCVEKTTKLYESNEKPKKSGDFKILSKIQSVWDQIDISLKETMEDITLEDILKLEEDNAESNNFKGKSLFDQFNPRKNKIFNIIDDDGKVVNPKWLGSINDKELVKAYKFMQYVRTADEMCMSYQRQGRLYTFPPNLGQEAISTATGFVMQEKDWMVPSYREVAAWILKGGTMKDIFLLWGGDEKGYLFSGANNILPISVPIASQLPHATGIGFALNYQEKDGAVFAFVGDGGTSEGDFHEALNFAGVWKVPVVFVIQNNQYAISVPVSRQTASQNLAVKSVAYGIPGIRVDGNDFLAMHKILTDARDYVTNGNGPILIEAVTYRKGAHTTSDDPSLYRTDEEEATWAIKDPIKRLRAHLIKKKLWKATDDVKLIEGYKKEVDAQFIDYENSPDYELDDVFDHIYEEIPEDLKKQKVEYEKYLNWERGTK
jgi:pyruvate dehydrogenase E1 component alpha subunit